MNWRSTAWLTGIAAALALFILVVERPARLARNRTAVAPPVVIGFDPASVTSIEIRVPNQDTFRIVRSNDLWVVAPPHAYPARQHLAEGLLERVAALRGHSILTTAELRARPLAPVEFGLSPATAAVTLSSPSGPLELLLGLRSLQGHQVYCQFSGIPGIFAADAALADHIPTQPLAWRETTLFPLDRLAFDHIRIDTQDAPFTLARNPTNGVWSLAEPRTARADPQRVGILIRQLGFLQINDFIAATAAPPAEIAGLKPPRLTVRLARGNTEVFGVAFGAPVSNTPALYARRLAEPETLTVPSEASQLLRLSYKDLLDRRLLRFDPGSLREIEFASADPFRLALLPDGWRLLPANLPADAALVDRLLASLAALEMIDIAKEIVTDLDLASYGLAPAPRQLILRTSPGDTNATVAVLETGALQNNLLCARVRGEQPVYLLNPADLDAVPTAAWQLRDRRLWRFDAPQVAAVTIRLPDNEWTVRRQGTNDWSVPPGLRNEINPFALDEALHAAGVSRALTWVAAGDSRDQDLGIGRGPELALELRGNNTTNLLRLALGKRSPAGHRYAATTLADGSRLTFELHGPTCDDLLRELGVGTAEPTANP